MHRLTFFPKAQSLELVPTFTHLSYRKSLIAKGTLSNQVETDTHFYRVAEISRDKLHLGGFLPSLDSPERARCRL